MSNGDLYNPRIVIDPEVVQKHRPWYFVLGIGLLALGIISLGASTLTTFASIIFFGWLLLISGVLQAGHALWLHRGSTLVVQLIAGILSLIVGLFLIFKPGVSALSLTLLLAAIFTATGLIRTIAALFTRNAHWGWLLVNGLVTLALGVMIGLEWPASSLWVIGVFVGIDLIFTGSFFIMLALAARRTAQS